MRRLQTGPDIVSSSKYQMAYESGGDSKQHQQIPINNFGDYITSKNISEQNSIALAFLE